MMKKSSKAMNVKSAKVIILDVDVEVCAQCLIHSIGRRISRTSRNKASLHYYAISRAVRRVQPEFQP